MTIYTQRKRIRINVRRVISNILLLISILIAINYCEILIKNTNENPMYSSCNVISAIVK